MSRFASLPGGRRGALAAGVAGLAIGGGMGAAIAHEVMPRAVMAPVSIVRIGALGTLSKRWFGETFVSVRGRVVEVFGDRFVVDDGSGRALIDAGRAPSDLVSIGQTVTVQGVADEGSLRAHFLVGADGQIIALRGPRGRHGEDRRSRDHERHPFDGPDIRQPVAPSSVAVPAN